MITVRVAAVKSPASKMRPSSGAVPRSSKKPGPTCPIWIRSEPGPPASVPRVNSGRIVGGHLLERLALLLPVAKVQIGGAIGQVLADVLRPHHRDAVGVVVRQVAQDDGAQDAENGGVRPNAKGERQHRQQR